MNADSMDTMYGLAVYALKTGACLAVFYLFFKLMLSRETFHRFNRAVILGVLLLSFVLPWCELTIYREVPMPETPGPMPEAFLSAFEEPADAVAAPFPCERIIGFLYAAGVAGMLAAMLVSVVRVWRIVRDGRRTTLSDGRALVLTKQPTAPFSWWRYIVLSESDYAESGSIILLHETAHLRMHHSWDLLLTDLAGCLQWFNPAMWLLRRDLRAIHEYEADEAVLDSGVDARQYQILLIKKAAGGRWLSVANSFNHSKLKNRITMMLQKKSSRWAGARALFVVPLAGIALSAFARTVEVPVGDKSMQNSDKSEIFAGKSDRQVKFRFQVVDASGEPMSGVAVFESGTASGTITDPDGAAELQIADSSSVELLMVGYETVHMTYSKGTVAMSGSGSMQATVSDDVVAVRVQMTPEESGVKKEVKVRTDVYVVKTSDDPIAIRGDGFEPDAKNRPLCLVDGEEVTDMQSLYQKRIESVIFLKDASAEAYVEKYGDKAKDGVVLITLRKEDDSTVDFQSDEWKEKLEELNRKSVELDKKSAELEAYFQSDEWKGKLEELNRKSAELDKKSAELEAYFQSDEWKEKQRNFEEAQKQLEAELKEKQRALEKAQ